MTATSELADWLRHIQQVHFRSIDLALDRVRRVGHVLRLARPATVITVAGTNGKGSMVAFLEAMLIAAGRRVGTYTSPHLVRYNERVRIAGEPVTDAALCGAFGRVERARRAIPLTYFEFGTLAALDLFQRETLDVALLEVGMGGRLDAVNMVDSDVAVITSIGIDHVQWLGPDRERIGAEKAGVMRRDRWCVCGDRSPPASIAAAARARGARLYQLGRDFDFERQQNGCWSWWGRDGVAFDDLPPPALPGDVQFANAAGALAALSRLAKPVPPAALYAGLGSAQLPGRLQSFGQAPQVILDVAHNPDAVAQLVALLTAQPVAGRTLAVFAMLRDKDIVQTVGQLAPLIDAWHVGGIVDERGADGASTAAMVTPLVSVPVTPYATAADAFQGARLAAAAADRIVVFGSFHTVGDIIPLLSQDE